MKIPNNPSKFLILLIAFTILNCNEEKPWYCVQLENSKLPNLINASIALKAHYFQGLNLSFPKSFIVDSLHSTKTTLKLVGDHRVVLFTKNEGIPYNYNSYPEFNSLSERTIYDQLYKSKNYCELKSVISPNMGTTLIKKYKLQNLDIYQYGNPKLDSLIVANIFTDQSSYTLALKNINIDEFNLILNNIGLPD